MNISKQIRSWQKISKLRRFLIIAIATIGFVLFIVFPALTQQPTTVTVLIQALEATQWQPLIEEFNRINRDIKLKVIEAPNASNAVEDLYTSSFLLGNSPYDLVYMDIVWVPKFAAAGWLLPLDDRINKQELGEYLKGDINGGIYQNELYRIPLRSDAGMLYYRKDLLEKAGYQPPNTYEELIQISQSMQKQKLADWGYVWQGKQYEGMAAMFAEILKGSGGFWIDPKTEEVGLDRPEAIGGIDFLRSTIEKKISPAGVITYSEPETLSLYQSGNAVFLRSWPYVFGAASEPESAIAGKFGIKPMVHAKGQTSGACQGGWGLGISATSKHPDAAWKVIEFMSSEAAQRKFVLATGYLPSRRVLFNDPQIVSKYSHYPELLEVVEKSVLRPPIAQYAQASDILQRYLSAALTNKMTPEAAMKAAATETRTLLGRK
ncbi:MAG: ABC transporter substrate-binding protein [Xenococcaceae cyanobacterium]